MEISTSAAVGLDDDTTGSSLISSKSVCTGAFVAIRLHLANIQTSLAEGDPQAEITLHTDALDAIAGDTVASSMLDDPNSLLKFCSSVVTRVQQYLFNPLQLQGALVRLLHSTLVNSAQLLAAK